MRGEEGMRAVHGICECECNDGIGFMGACMVH